ncbi:type IV toxin-antitoxin system AbiEi family antitoxin domain-containing protein [Candidatus Woesearchaeota archaeon]|nr:type IV toxin-antitoxin system AbiEi family antitoxin domain-containing protein [Candidatus Woesearchaeota archaeon]
MTKKTRKGLGEKSAIVLSTLSEKNKNIFNVDDVAAILHEKRSSIIKLLHDLTKKRWLFRISKGIYLILPLEAGAMPKFTEHEFILASRLISPYYISYWSALNYYGLTEQVSKTIFIATLKRKLEKEIMGLKFRFITLNKNKFFGFKAMQLNNHIIKIAEVEKAIIDCLDLPRNCGGIVEVIKAIDEAKKEIDFNKLIAYAKKMQNAAILNRLGYILELLGIKANIKPSKHYVMLDTISKKKGIYNKKWKIVENVSREELLSWREH